MKILILVLTVIVSLLIVGGLVIYLIGQTQPERHTTSITFTLTRAPAQVWTALTDYGRMPEWWPAVKAVQLETKPDGEIITWNSDKHGQRVGFRTKESSAPHRLVREIVGDDLPFGGTWTFDLADSGNATRVTLTEDGFVKSPVLRGIARIFFKPDATVRDFERHFATHLAAK